MAETPASILDPEAVAGLVEAFDSDGLRDLVDEYLADAERLFGLLDAVVAANDGKAIYDAAHQLKSTSESLGARAFAAQAAALEQAGRSGQTTNAPALLRTLRDAYGPVAIAVRALAP